MSNHNGGASIKKLLNDELAEKELPVTVTSLNIKSDVVTKLEATSEYMYDTLKNRAEAKTNMKEAIGSFFGAKYIDFSWYSRHVSDIKMSRTHQQIQEDMRRQKEEEEDEKRRELDRKEQEEEESQAHAAAIVKIKRKRDEGSEVEPAYDHAKVMNKHGAYNAVATLWENQLTQQVDAILNAAPWKNKEKIKKQIAERISGLVNQFIIPGAGGNSQIANVFQGDISMLFQPYMRTYDYYDRLDIYETMKLYSQLYKLKDEELESPTWKENILYLSGPFELGGVSG